MGGVVAAAEEERFLRMKHWAGFPAKSIRYCLTEAGATIDEVDHVAINHKLTANLGRRLLFTLGNRPRPSYLLDRLSNARAWQSIDRKVQAEFPGEGFSGRIHQVEHHMAHIASAFWYSPFDTAVALSIDGLGDFASAAWGLGEDNKLTIQGRVYQPHSLGIFYTALTQFLGFTTYGDEYKVMGLAPYGEPRYVDQLREVVLLQPDGTYRLNLDYFRFHREDFGYQWRDCAPEAGAGVLDAARRPTRAAAAAGREAHRPGLRHRPLDPGALRDRSVQPLRCPP